MPFYGQGIQAVEQPGELPGVDGHDLGLGSRPAKHMALQALVPQAKPVAVPVEQLDDRPAAVVKAKQLAGERVKSQLLRDQDGQAVNGLAHVRGPQGQVDPDAVCRQHHSRVSVRTSFSSTGAAKSPLISMRKALPTCTSIGSGGVAMSGWADVGNGTGTMVTNGAAPLSFVAPKRLRQ